MSVISLPASTFRAAGTSTKTSILHLRKKCQQSRQAVYFATCQNIGYDIGGQGAPDSPRREASYPRYSTRREATPTPRQPEKPTQPPGDGFCSTKTPLSGTRPTTPELTGTCYEEPNRTELNRTGAEQNGAEGTLVGQVATLSNERFDPSRSCNGESCNGEFRYVEISDIDERTRTVRCKMVECQKAPSRAKKVVRTGDVLISTVRPERRTVGVVGPELDGAICSTGLAVLNPKGIHPHILAKLLQTDFANAQIVRNATGIAYPAVDENRIPDTVLPITKNQIKELSGPAENVARALANLKGTEVAFSSELDAATTYWLGK